MRLKKRLKAWLGDTQIRFESYEVLKRRNKIFHFAHWGHDFCYFRSANLQFFLIKFDQRSNYRQGLLLGKLSIEIFLQSKDYFLVSSNYKKSYLLALARQSPPSWTINFLVSKLSSTKTRVFVLYQIFNTNLIAVPGCSARWPANQTGLCSFCQKNLWKGHC